MTYEDNQSLTLINNLTKSFGESAVKCRVMKLFLGSVITARSVRANICPGDMTKYIVHIVFAPMDWALAESVGCPYHPEQNDIVLIGNHPMEMRAYCLPKPNAPMLQSYFDSHAKGLTQYDAAMHLSILNAVMGHVDTSKEVRP